MMKRNLRRLAAACIAATALGILPAHAKDLTFSSGLPRTHFWVGDHMDGFADVIEERTNGEIKFTRFYGGELVRVGGELDALTNGTIDVAGPLLAPYHEGRFPLSDVTQLPMNNTNARMATEAFQELMDSKAEVKPGSTFYQYEIGSKNIVAWPIGATPAFVISTTGKELKTPADFKGVLLRAGSALHTMVLENLGATPVYMPGTQAYEAMSRGTIDGMTNNIADWFAYSFQEVLKYTVKDANLGHWESYLAVSNATWDSFTDEQKQAWDKAAREKALTNADFWEKNRLEVIEKTTPAGAKYPSLNDMSDETKAFFAEASLKTWTTWIEKNETAGHPARATAKLWADLMAAKGAELPTGVSEYLSR
jgi:TRAP-type C4-dicarboxylate transport system substrate-binding protein